VLIGTMALIAVGFMLSYMSPQTWLYKSATFEGTAFENIAPTTHSSFTKEKLSEIETYLKEESNTTSMLVLEHGKIVYEYGDISEISYNASVRKSILSMLYGKYVTNGTIDLNQTIGDMGVDDVGGLLPIEKQATIDHIITARSGIFHLPANGGYDTDNVKERGSVNPGEYFLYNNWDYNAAGYIFEEKTGNTVYEELEQQLAVPLGFQDWNIENQFRTTNESNSRYSAYHMHLSTRDMAKIGQLMLQEGTWNGKQLIDKDWIKKTITPVTPSDTIAKRYHRDASNPVHSSYGYMWWLYERFYDNPDFEGAYSARGAFGQYITVIPKRNVVVVHKTTIDLLTLLNFSDRSSTPYWRYLWILRTLMLDGKSIEQLATKKSTDEIIEFIKIEYNKDSKYAISERLINEYGLSLAEKGKYEKAIQFYKLNLELYPKGYYTHRTLNYYGDCLLKLGRNDEALNVFERSLVLNEWNEVAKKEISKLKDK
jgi:CubicO group peptidase (beta-lactamase class C family)